MDYLKIAFKFLMYVGLYIGAAIVGLVAILNKDTQGCTLALVIVILANQYFEQDKK